MEVAGGGGVGEDGFYHEDEFGAVFAVVENGRRVFGRRRKVADARVERGGAAGDRDAHGGAGGEGGELGFWDEEADLDVFGGQEGNDGVAGGDEFALAVKGIVNERGARGGLGFLGHGPVGLFLGGERGADLGGGGGEGIGAAAEAGGGKLGFEFFEGAGVFLVGEAGAVVVAGGEDAGLEEIFLAGEVELGEFGGGAGLVEAGGKGGEFAGALALAGVGEPGLGGAELVGGLALGGEFVGVFQREERSAGGDAGALGDGELFELAAEGRADVDEFALEVALVTGGFLAGTAGETEKDGAEKQQRRSHARDAAAGRGGVKGRSGAAGDITEVDRRRAACLLYGMSAAQANVRVEIAGLIARKDLAGLKSYIEPWLPMDLAPMLTDLSVEELAVLFRVGSRELDATIFVYVPFETQKKLLKLLTQEQAAALLNGLPPDDRTAFLNELPLDVAMQLLGMMSPAERQVAQTLLAYPEHSVGRMMTLDFVTVRSEWTVRQALDHIREHGYDRETLNMIYVVDADGRLIDDVRVRRFLLSPPERPVSALLDGNFTMLAPMDDREKALGLFKAFDRVALPVVDEERKIIGIVTVDDMLDVAEAEATEDIQKLGGSEALDEPYTTIPLRRMVKKRASWLVVLFLGEMLTATAMAFFEDEIAKAVVLALFVPLVISSGGNAGSQAATLVIRALALGEFKLRDWWRVMRRELAAGTALGLILGTIGFLRIAVWSQFSAIYGPHWFLVGATVGLSLVGIVLWGSIMGSMLPLLLKRVGFDPATSSAPFVATLVDVTGLIIYFSVAFLILRGTLL